MVRKILPVRLIESWFEQSVVIQSDPDNIEIVCNCGVLFPNESFVQYTELNTHILKTMINKNYDCILSVERSYLKARDRP